MKTKQIHLVVDVPEDYIDCDADITIDDMLKNVNPEYWNWHIIEAGEPVAWLIDWPDEPELGSYFSEATSENGRSRPLYLHPSGDAKDALIAAAQAVVDRWETPAWKDVPHTGEYVHRLRKAIEASKEK